MADKRAIMTETLDLLAKGFQKSRGITDKLTTKQMIAFAEEPVASGENKLPQLIDGTITEITAADLQGATQIRSYAFNQCPLTSIVLTNEIQDIGQSALSYTNIQSLIIPNSVNMIGYGCCQGCSLLSYAEINASILDSYAFYQTPALTNVVIGENISNIKTYSLHCGSTNNNATFTFLGTTPPTITTNIFNKNYLNKIIVPAGYGEVYKTATNWANFADYIEEATV